VSEKKNYVSASQEWWLKYFESSEEEKARQTYMMATSILWDKKELDRNGWTQQQRTRIDELTAEVGPALSSIDYANLTPEDLKKKTDALGVTEQVLEMQEIWQEVAEAKLDLDNLLSSQENKGEENEGE
jgi:hypothetical protein